MVDGCPLAVQLAFLAKNIFQGLAAKGKKKSSVIIIYTAL